MTYILLKPSNSISNALFSAIREKISIPLTDLQQRILVVVSLALAFLTAISYYVTKHRHVTKVDSVDKSVNNNPITKVILANGTVLEGATIPKIIEGNARIIFANGDYAKGFFNKALELEGMGESSIAQILRAGTFERGKIKEGIIFDISSNLIKEGFFDELERLQGKGRLISKDKLELGEFVDNILVKGTIIYFGAEDKPNILLEEGTFSKGQLDDKSGIRIYSNQKFEKGQFVKGEFQGKAESPIAGKICQMGAYRFDSDGNITQGEYNEQGVLTRGKRFIFNGNKIGYEKGNFKDSCLIKGNVILFDQSSDIRFEGGDYSNGLLNGRGARILKNGIFQRGEFEQGLWTEANQTCFSGKDGCTFEGETLAYNKESRDCVILGWGTKTVQDGSYLRGNFDQENYGEFIEGEIFSAIHNYRIIGKFQEPSDENKFYNTRTMTGKFINLDDNPEGIKLEEGTFEVSLNNLFKSNCHSLEGQGKRTYKDGRIEEGTFIGGVFQNQP